MKKKFSLCFLICFAIVIVSGSAYYQFVYDPIITEIIQDDEKTKVIKIIHLKDNRVEYVINHQDGIGAKEES